MRGLATKGIWIAVACLAVAFALRCYRLSAQSLWYDEGVSWYLTTMSLPKLTAWTANDIQPPLYYYVLWGWVRLAGDSEYSLRFPSVVFAVLSLPFFWLIARRLQGKLAAWLSLAIAVISPLYVYYSQEARMYTLLTWLGLFGSWLLLRLLDVLEAGGPADQGRRQARLLAAAYALVAAAMLYTHYFALFLLLAHGLYVLYRWLAAGRPGWRILWLVPAVIILLFLPWLPFLVTRYGIDTSYWPGSLKLAEVGRNLLITFALGETVKEGPGWTLTFGYVAIWLLSLFSFVTATAGNGQSKRSRSSLVFLLLYCLVPILLMGLLAYRTPKFNPRYAMFVSPAVILITGCGLGALLAGSARWKTGDRRIPPSRLPAIASRLVAALMVGYVLVTSGYSLHNWFLPYRENQFNKADFRITATIVSERAGPEDAVLLNSGHMFPAWAYYYGWDGWYGLPDIDVLDVNAVLDLTVGGTLNDLLAGKRGVWLVRWQNEVTDPFNVLPLYLGSVGRQDDYGQFWHMELYHYQLPEDADFSLEDFVTEPIGATFENSVLLVGARYEEDKLILIWQPLRRLDRDYTIFVHILDQNGQTVISADHLPSQPTHLWPAGQVLPDQVELALPVDPRTTPLWLEVGLYDAAVPAMPRLGPVDCPSCSDTGENRVLVPLEVDAG